MIGHEENHEPAEFWYRTPGGNYTWNTHIGGRKVKLIMVRSLYRWGWAAYEVDEQEATMIRIAGSAWVSRHANKFVCAEYAGEWLFKQREREEKENGFTLD